MVLLYAMVYLCQTHVEACELCLRWSQLYMGQYGGSRTGINQSDAGIIPDIYHTVLCCAVLYVTVWYHTYHTITDHSLCFIFSLLPACVSYRHQCTSVCSASASARVSVDLVALSQHFVQLATGGFDSQLLVYFFLFNMYL